MYSRESYDNDIVRLGSPSRQKWNRKEMTLGRTDTDANKI